MITLLIFFNDTATTEIYTLSLHDALPIFRARPLLAQIEVGHVAGAVRQQVLDRDPLPALVLEFRDEARDRVVQAHLPARSEEHTSELQSRQYLVCRLLLEKKKTLIQQQLA